MRLSPCLGHLLGLCFDVVVDGRGHVLLMEILLPTHAQLLLGVVLVLYVHALGLVRQPLDARLVAGTLIDILRQHTDALALVWLGL